MLSPSHLAQIVATALAVAVAFGILALIALRLTRRRSVLVRLGIVVLTAICSIIASSVAIAYQMYLSDTDLTVLCWVIGISGLVSVGLAVMLGTGIARSSARLRSTVHAIGEGRVVGVDGHDTAEFESLARELAETSTRLAAARDDVARLDASRRQLVAWISHDLRTPLAALRAMAETLEDGLAADPARYLRQMRGQTDTLTSMVDDLFELSKIQSGTLNLSMERLSLFDLVSDVVADLHALASARSVTLTESRTGDLTVWGDARELSRVVGNLLMNAIQHSPAGSEILISAHETSDGKVALSVVDAGGGVPEEDLSKIFDAGWRGSPARASETALGISAGAGLGLAIVHGIVEAHAGGVRVQNVPGGCRFDVVLPRFARASPDVAV